MIIFLSCSFYRKPIQEKKREFYENQNKAWNFKDALQKHHLDTIKLYQDYAVAAHSLSIDMQEALHESTGIHSGDFLCCFRSATFIMHAFSLLQQFALAPNQVLQVKEDPAAKDNPSAEQHVWEKYLRWKYPEETMTSTFTAVKGCKKVQREMWHLTRIKPCQLKGLTFSPFS